MTPGATRILVQSSGDYYLTPDEAEALAGVAQRMVQAARAAANDE